MRSCCVLCLALVLCLAVADPEVQALPSITVEAIETIAPEREQNNIMAEDLSKNEVRKPVQERQNGKQLSTEEWNKLFCPPAVTRNSLNLKAEERLVLSRTRHGFDMYVDSKDRSVSKTIITSGSWEPENIKIIGHIVKRGDNVLNLGSQSGLEAIIMGKAIGPTGRLFIFEPYSVSNQMVTKNVQLNGLSDITTVYQYGASDHEYNATISISYGNTGGSEIHDTEEMKKRNAYSAYSQQEVVNLVKVDDLLPKDISLNFALIDVEKMEVPALTGMKEVIARSPNLVLMVEWQRKLQSDHKTQQLLDFLYEKGYSVYINTRQRSRDCSIGKFFKLSNESLFNAMARDLFFFPKTVAPPKI